MNKIEEIKARWDAAQKGPWGWFGAPGSEFKLATKHSGRRYVMTFARMGMKGAQPMFQPESGMVPAKDLCIFEVCREAESADDPRVYRRDIVGFRAPDAVAIAAAPEDVSYLLSHCTALEALAVELAGALVKLDQHMDFGEPMDNGERCHWESATGINGAMEGARTALASPLLAELLGKEGDEPADCTSCDGSGEISYPLMENGEVDFISGCHVGLMGECQDCGGTGKQEAGQ